MCGIYGFVADELGPSLHTAERLTNMDRAIRHRGPDDRGTYVDRHCALGMRRLSIIDLDGGRQPIANEDRSIWVVYNGEIYNYRALKRELEARGHRFATSSDTEVIVHLYEDRGESFLDALDGMFGLALWDRRSELLLLARDRLGIKPLYYAPLADGLVFGSELKSLLCHPAVSRRVSPEALSHYLSFGSTPPDRAILDGVAKLEPAHLLRYRHRRIELRRYWDLCPAPRAHALSLEDAATEVRERIRSAVRSHLTADVPVGAFLSGGIDSATVVGTMVELGVHPKTFSIGFDEPDFDELRWSRLTARHFGTDHYELVVRPDVWELTDALPWFLDEPFADVSVIPTYLVSKLAAEHVKVVLTGDGGDEVFAGYDRYPHALAEARRLDRLPAFTRALFGRLGAALPEVAPGKHWLRHAGLPPRLRFVDGESLFPSHLKARLMSPSLAAACANADPVEARARLLESAPGDSLAHLLYYDTATYLPLDILTKVDRMTMACSLEARPPLLDHHLVEAVFAMPSALKLEGVAQKRVMKRAVADLVPRPILGREKRGFGVPIRKWFRGPLREALADVLTDGRTRARGWLEPRAVRALLDEHLSGRRDQSVRLWSLLMLELWCRRFLDQPARAAASPVEERASFASFEAAHE